MKGKTNFISPVAWETAFALVLHLAKAEGPSLDHFGADGHLGQIAGLKTPQIACQESRKAAT